MVQQITRGIKIEVKQNFEGTFYKNHKIHFAFGYVVTIENRSKDTVQLNSRHWTILDSLNKEIVIMHPGPINRGVEITSDVADSNHSVILNQVENGVAVRMAVIYLLASKIKQ